MPYLFMVAVYSADVHLVSPNLNGRIVTPLMGWQFRTANSPGRFGPIRFACVLPWRSQQSFSSRLVSSRPAGYTNPSRVMGVWVMVSHQFPELAHQS